MARKMSQQFMEALNGKNHVLITTRKDWTVDGVATALAIKSVLERRRTNVDVIIDGFSPGPTLSFLEGIDTIRPAFGQLQKFVISLDVSKSKLDELSYDVKEGRLNIYVTPKEGRFRDKDVSTAASEFKYDLIVTVDTPDHDSLGRLFSEHTDLFHQLPVINIDHDTSNEQYGNLNLTDITATSCAEVVHGIFRETPENTLDERVATALLTGIIAKTRSFKSPNVTPRTLDAASVLVAAGARREEIVQQLYRTRSLATLKLWGRALARLKHDPETRTVWTLLLRQDFVHAGANEEFLPEVIHELIVNAPEAEIVSLIYEQESAQETGKVSGVCALVTSERHADALGLVSSLRPEGDRRLARVCFPGVKIMEAEKAVIGSIRASLGKGPHPTWPLVAEEASSARPTGS
ncbi:hypothetical protein AMJ57_00485 [Parcubacteria bacterium SG8_24]|nr:MAG: hypothetical protein AMJ57_00485 [Parcubacteria bacterium SG8_24]